MAVALCVEGRRPSCPHSNDYDYVSAEPIKGYDLDGRCGVWGNPWKKCGRGHRGQRGFLGGVLTKAGASASICYGIATGGCVGVTANGKDGFGANAGWTGYRKKRFFFGISAAAGPTWQSHATSSRSHCGSVWRGSVCRATSGRRTRVYGLSPFSAGASGGAIKTRSWSWKPW